MGPLKAGTPVRVTSSGMLPYLDREGVVELPNPQGCYVRFPDKSKVWCYWAEIDEVR